jgi:hypothetical protein
MNTFQVVAFGDWDAPITDGAGWLAEAPVELKCFYCDEHFAEGDNGAIMPTGFAQHRECSLRGALGGIGHLVDHDYFCGGPLGPDAGLSFRASAMLVWNLHVGKGICTRDMLLLLGGDV